MSDKEHCYDCIFCDTSYAPVEIGVEYECYNDKADQYKDRIDPWQEACKYAKFMTNEV